MTTQDLFRCIGDLSDTMIEEAADIRRKMRWLPIAALAACAADVAIRRHAGYYAKEADPVMGIMAGAPMGRDLRNVRQVLCVGGIFLHCHGEERENIVRRTFDNPGISLLPLNDPDIWFDEDYILYAMGVLAQHYPEEVLSYMKEHVIKK